MIRITTFVALIGLAGAAPALAQEAKQETKKELSTSIMRPSPLDQATGMVAGKLPGGTAAMSYYVAVDLKPGMLMAQLEVAGRPNGERRLAFELLDGNAKIADSAFVRAGFGGKDEVTRSFAIDASGRHIVRLVVSGEETGTFCVVMAGSALPNVNAASCPAPAAAIVTPSPVAPPPPAARPAAPPPKAAEQPAPKAVEVIVSKCEERLRVGADFLFDFDRAEVRPEAAAAMSEIAQRIAALASETSGQRGDSKEVRAHSASEDARERAGDTRPEPGSSARAAANKAVMIEGHTDGKGTESYNQGLSERRAGAVRTALVGRGLEGRQLIVRGFGKSRPVAANERPDGSDDPDGRQKNRRVEVVINTCG
jgi:outer membrane protein OmpA-like peptidoglycan-associated protein